MKKIKYGHYKIYQILVAVILAIIISSFVVLGNFIVSLAAFLVAAILIFVLRKNVDAKLEDERINQIAGRASRIVMTTAVMIMSVAGIILVSLRNTYPQYWLIGNILIYFECGMMLLYSILFKFFSSRKI
jgi:uncharacterized membrane protein